MSEKRLLQTYDYYFQQASKIQGNKSSSHYHSLIEIYYMKRGKCNYFIDDKSYKVEAGDLVFIPSGIIHKTTYDTEFHDRWLINCSEFFIPESVLGEIKSLPHVFRRSAVTAECERVTPSSLPSEPTCGRLPRWTPTTRNSLCPRGSRWCDRVMSTPATSATSSLPKR